MAKKIIRKYLPDYKKIQNNKYLRIFGDLLHNPNLWHLNRYSVATGVSVGLFCAYLPFPGHMLSAALLSIMLHANLPISILLVWISNPFTMAPQFYIAYKLGTRILGITPQPFHVELSLGWFLEELHTYAYPLLIGSLLCASVLACVGNIAVRLFWRYSVTQSWKKRKAARRNYTSNT